jgi:hypothetical protein
MTSDEDTIPGSLMLTPAEPGPLPPVANAAEHDRLSRQRVLRIRITDVVSGQLKVSLSLPAGLVGVAMRMGARFVPAGHTNAEVLEAFERGDLSTPMVLEDVENGELVEISVEG